ncbi:MAG: hypothetical protein LW809_02955 [Vampirovibrionales bacterium]|jgi:hypothetical protein|nr:hypothetical protein [Vampirovibrionales bacterium]
MAKRPPVDPLIISMNAEALSVEFAEKVTEALSSSGLNVSEIKRSADITAHFIQVAVGLLQQEPGFQPQDPKAPYLAFNVGHCYKVLSLFTHAIIYASEKAQEHNLKGEPKSIILQGLAKDAFFQAKQFVSATVGQEATPELQFDDEQLESWIEQMVAGALHHYLGEYENIHGPIGQEDMPPDAPTNRFNKTPQAELPLEEETLTVEEDVPAFQANPQASMYTMPSPQQAQVFPSYEDVYASPPQPEPVAIPYQNTKHVQLKLAALALFLTTQAPPLQNEWLNQFPAEVANQIVHYMNVENIAQELPMNEVLEKLNEFRRNVKAVAEDPHAQEKRLRHALCEILARPDNRSVLESLMQGERTEIQRLFKTAGLVHKHPNGYNQIPQWTPKLEQALFNYYNTILA